MPMMRDVAASFVKCEAAISQQQKQVTVPRHLGRPQATLRVAVEMAVTQRLFVALLGAEERSQQVASLRLQHVANRVLDVGGAWQASLERELEQEPLRQERRAQPMGRRRR